MRWKPLLGRMLQLGSAVVEASGFDAELDELVVRVRPDRRYRPRCSRCGKYCPGYDTVGERSWRGLDLGVVRTRVVAVTKRVQCPEHGVVVSAVPWARGTSRFTRAFEDVVAWTVARVDKTTVKTMFRIAWRSVGRIVERVTSDGLRGRDQLAGLRRIGIDEISYKKRHKYIIVVVDHDTGRLVWAREGRTRATMDAFFEELGPERCAAIELVSADGAGWIEGAVSAACPGAVQCLDPFHAVQWVSGALDRVRRELWSSLRRSGDTQQAKTLQRSRFALWKNPEDLTPRQQSKLSDIQSTNKGLYRAYLLKEQFREVIRLKGEAGKAMLDAWCSWAQRCRLTAFVEVQRKIRKHRTALDAALDHGLSNARIEGLNTRLRLLSRLAFGFHSATAFIALGMLKLGGLCPELPGRC